MTNVLVITGMHRSGTSLIAQQLQALGWDVGPDADLMPPKPDNPRGFVEHLPAVRINDRILHRLGGSWRRPPALPPGWATESELDDLRDEAQEVMDALLARGSERLLLKDPRFSLTLPFWRTVTHIHQVLIVLRPPGDVVTSLLRRGDELDGHEAARLWIHYLVAGLRNAPDAHLTATEHLLADPAARLRKLSSTLGHDSSDDDVAAAVQLVEDDLWGRSSRKLGTTEPPLAALTQARLLQAVITGEDGEAWQAVLGTFVTLEELAAAERRGRDRVGAERARHDQVLERIPRLQAQAAQAHERAERIRAERDQARELKEQLQKERDDAVALLATVWSDESEG